MLPLADTVCGQRVACGVVTVTVSDARGALAVADASAAFSLAAGTRPGAPARPSMVAINTMVLRLFGVDIESTFIKSWPGQLAVAPRSLVGNQGHAPVDQPSQRQVQGVWTVKQPGCQDLHELS